MFEGEGSRDANNLLPDGKVYVVLEQLNKEGNKEKEQLEFGLEVVNQKGEKIGKGTKALLITDKSAGLLSIQAFFSLGDRVGEIDEGLEKSLMGMSVRPVFDAKANDIEAWLGDIRKTTDGNLSNTVIWTNKHKTQDQSRGVNIISRWQSWCGKEGDNGNGKKLKLGKNADTITGKDYKKTDKDIDLQVSPPKSANTEEKWALVPIGKPIMKINLGKSSLKSETIEGTLEQINNYFIIFCCLYVMKQWHLCYKSK